jgi:3-deoxy-D-manno-octulosonic-acid transferase
VEKVLMLLYEIGIRLFVLGIRVAAFFNAKARKWVEGRRHWRERHLAALAPIPNPQSPISKTLWLHAASLGEFEQGRPVIEAFREQFPEWRIVLTFFSPSGYEIRKDYPHADLVCYLPADTRRNARDFLDLIKPDAVIFVKYEFWANYLFELKKRDTPTLLVSALFRDKQPFFQWYGGFWRKMLGCFTHIFVQNETSAKLLQRIGFQNITVSGDTRVDRVLKIAEGAGENEIVAAFCPPQPPQGGEGVAPLAERKRIGDKALLPPLGGLGGAFIAGSSWPADEAVFLPVFQKPEFHNFKLIIAPHEPAQAGRTFQSAATILADWKARPILYSQTTLENVRDARILLIDNVGLLNTLYRYGTVAYIGGGFGKGIHNTLEPAAFGLPIIFGPKYEKFEEARQFVARGGAFPVRNPAELEAVLKKLQDPDFYEKASQAVRGYLEENKGATERILVFLKSLTA